MKNKFNKTVAYKSVLLLYFFTAKIAQVELQQPALMFSANQQLIYIKASLALCKRIGLCKRIVAEFPRNQPSTKANGLFMLHLLWCH